MIRRQRPELATSRLKWQILNPVIVVSFVFVQAFRLAWLPVVVGWRAAAVIGK